ncbi:MAG: putative O-glycosylation ligase, exosortase A system-associated [Magnetococcales bacterium]|nr:putative O-glycosylation ligase, exosortase A system-associated [Magnetococcales bacterium]
MRDLFLLLFVFGMLPVCFVRPQVGLLMWVWIGYMSPHRLTWSYAYDFRFNFFIAFVTMAGLLLGNTFRFRIPVNRVTILWLFFIVWACVTTATAFHAGAGRDLDRFLKVQMMILAVYMVITNRVWLDRMIWVMVLSVGFWGVKGGVFTIMHGGNYRIYGPAGSFFEDNNALALALIMILPLMRYLQLHSKYLVARLTVGFLIVNALLTILGSYSRGGLVGFTVLAVAFFMKSRHKMIVLMISIVLALGAWQFMPEKWHERMGNITSFHAMENIEADDSVSGRVNSWRFAVNLVQDRPFLGGGFRTFNWDAFQKYAPVKWVHDAHSIYFEVLAEQGLPGFIAFLLMFFTGFRYAGWVVRNTRQRPDLLWARDLAAMAQVSLVGYGSAGAFLGLGYFDLPYHVLAIVVILREWVREDLARQPRTKQAGGLGRVRSGPLVGQSIFMPPRGRGMAGARS